MWIKTVALSNYNRHRWHAENCDGDWEHSYGILIGTLDNPGWEIIIDLNGTPLEKEYIEYKLVEKSESDWYGFSVENSKFKGVGDPSKLSFLLLKFKKIVEGYS
jgi:hypothetical protein